MSARGRRGGGRGALIGKKRRTPAQAAADRARKLARRELLPTPRSKAGARATLRTALPNTEEVAFIRRSALAEVLAGDLAGPYSKELAQLRRRTYAGKRGAQKKRDGSARARSRHTSKKAGRIKVRAHTRGRAK